jgi:hypothetical protein
VRKNKQHSIFCKLSWEIAITFHTIARHNFPLFYRERYPNPGLDHCEDIEAFHPKEMAI